MPNHSISKKHTAGPSIWLEDLTYTQQTIAADVIPNAIGGIATYTESHLDLRDPIRLFKYPDSLVEALDRDGPPDIIGFSNYIWNRALSERFVEAIKEHRPETVTIFGGPNYPVDLEAQEAFLRRHPQVDFYIVKEGEIAFARLVESLLGNGMDVEATKRVGLPSVHAVAADGAPFLADHVERLRDLSEIPSPYITGRLDEFFDGMLLPIIQTNRGCPFSCTFCVEGVGYYNKIHRNAGEKVSNEIDYIGRKMQALRKKGGRNDLFIADSNFGMYKEDLDTCRAIASSQKHYQWPEYINVATGKNQKERVIEASRIINGALRLSGSVQSLDTGVLENIKRNNISADALIDLALMASEVGANSYSEIILGLPGDSIDAHLATVRTIMDAGFTNIYLFQLMLLPGTELATDETKEKYGMVSRYRVLPRCYGHYRVLGAERIAAEIEEICVANNTLSFEDYLYCRRQHLIITIFHNDGVFESLLKLLRVLDVSIYRWMELIGEATIPGALDELFKSFEQATRDELWEDRVALEDFVQQPGVVEKFINGELGNNLLFVHKTRAITHHVEELAELARQTILQCLAEAGHTDEAVCDFVDDALVYHATRMAGIFDGDDREPSQTLRYDIRSFETERNPGALEDYRFDKPRTYRFVLEESQRNLIDRYLNIYGDSVVGIGRIVSKVYVRNLFRHAVSDRETPQAISEFRTRIAGLQN